jgi:hypothetical protein
MFWLGYWWGKGMSLGRHIAVENIENPSHGTSKHTDRTILIDVPAASFRGNGDTVLVDEVVGGVHTYLMSHGAGVISRLVTILNAPGMARSAGCAILTIQIITIQRIGIDIAGNVQWGWQLEQLFDGTSPSDVSPAVTTIAYPAEDASNHVRILNPGSAGEQWLSDQYTRLIISHQFNAGVHTYVGECNFAGVRISYSGCNP